MIMHPVGKFRHWGRRKQVPLALSKGSTINPTLPKLLKKISFAKELIVDLNVKELLKIWFTGTERVCPVNCLVVALNDEMYELCKSNNVPVLVMLPKMQASSTLGRHSQKLSLRTVLSFKSHTIHRRIGSTGFSMRNCGSRHPLDMMVSMLGGEPWIVLIS
ncbi:hypothetical protein LINPERHAP1_LOCUS15485 [Linum perenne]